MIFSQGQHYLAVISTSHLFANFDQFGFGMHLLFLEKVNDPFEVCPSCKSLHGRLFAVKILEEDLAAFRHLLSLRHLDLKDPLLLVQPV